MQVRFDWFDVTEEMTIAEICRRKAVNLVRDLEKKISRKDLIFI
jgi:hypothetical protein